MLGSLHHSTLATGLLIVLAAFLGACSTAPLGTTSESSFDRESAESYVDRPALYDSTPLPSLIRQADPHVQQGQPIPAELAIRLLAASNREQDWSSLDAVIDNSQPDSMTGYEFAEYSIQLLRAWHLTEQHQQAERWLNGQRFLNQLPLMDADQQLLLSIERANNHRVMGRQLESARERVFIEDFIKDKKARQENANAIWESLLATPRRQLQRALQQPGSDNFSAWLEIALVQQDLQQDAHSQTRAAQTWQQRWPGHSANQLLSRSMRSLEATAGTEVNTIGVFLPLSGRLKGIGEAVRDGLLTAHFSQAGDSAAQPRLHFYDTQAASISDLYQQALDDGVEVIIGPLQKSQVKALFTMPTNLPILTLNFVPDDLPPPDNIVQFGLAAEDEARQLARAAQAMGYRRPLLLSADKDWAQRAASSFAQQWQRYSDQPPMQQRLSISENYSSEIASSLGLPASERRHHSLQNATGTSMVFKPRRRQDIDVVILLGNDETAKTVKPLLAYHYAGKLPVLASSHIYNASDRGRHSDLNGVMFSEMPWFLNGGNNRSKADRKLEQSLYRSKSQQRLYAMGIDAYTLHSRLDRLRQFPQMRWQANTGRLSISNNRIVRELPMAKMVAGRPQSLAGE